MTLKLKKSSGYWYVEGTVAGERVRQSTRLPATPSYKALAERERLKLESDVIEGKFGNRKMKTTFQEACDDYIKWKRIEGKNTKLMSRILDKTCLVLGGVPLSELTSQTLQVFATGAWPGNKPGSIKRNMGIVRAALRYAEKVNEGYKAPEVFMPKVNDARDMHFDEREANAFLEWVGDNHPDLKDCFLTLIDTGVRLNELCSLRSSNFGTDVLRVRKKIAMSGKTQTRDIPLTSDMVEVAHRYRNQKATEPVFRSSTGSALTPEHGTKVLNRVLKEGLKALGMEYEGYEAMRVHDLRHTFAYLTAKAGADLGDLQYLMGHEDISQTMRYRGFIQSRARTYVAKMRCV